MTLGYFTIDMTLVLTSNINKIMKKIILLLGSFVALSSSNYAQTVSDVDGNIYNTVIIDTQEWMKENLKTTRYNDNTIIPLVTNNSAWAALSTPAYCYYNNDSLTYNAAYGAMYNWFAVNTGKLCPTGWHVPTDIDWNNLIGYLGGSFVASSALKEVGISHWTSPNSDADNSSGFTALPAGHRMLNGVFNDIGGFTSYWTSTEDAPSYAPYRFLSYLSSEVKRYSFTNDEFFGLSVRCLNNTVMTHAGNIENSNTLKIFPNPANDKIYINNIERQILKVQIFNVVGECVIQKVLDNTNNEICIDFLSKGIYVIKINCDKWSMQQKFIKD